MIKAGLTIDPVVVSASLERFIRDQVEVFQREGAILGMRGGGVDNGEWIMGDREKRVESTE